MPFALESKKPQQEASKTFMSSNPFTKDAFAQACPRQSVSRYQYWSFQYWFFELWTVCIFHHKDQYAGVQVQKLQKDVILMHMMPYYSLFIKIYTRRLLMKQRSCICLLVLELLLQNFQGKNHLYFQGKKKFQFKGEIHKNMDGVYWK